MVSSNAGYSEAETVIRESTVSVHETPMMTGMTGDSAEKCAQNSDPVREFYTEHPYPPPVENLDRARDEWRGEDRLRAEYHLLWPNKNYRSDLNILVAGCGTWQAAKYALCQAGAQVVGIDVSSTSLDYTEQLKHKYDLTNLELQQLPIEDAALLDRRFDLIVCTGVLHHLANPDAGLQALRSVLKPDGVINLMVYAPYGRTGVYMLQDYCRKLGVGNSLKEINELATVVESLPPRHPLVVLLGGTRDASNADALADALLNPRDRSYSVPQLFEFIERNGLRFGRWYRQAPYSPRCGVISTTPHANRLTALPMREQYAAMELWRGTMTCHSAVVVQNDRSDSHANVRFDDRKWLFYVPHRLPSTLCVEERLPAGAAGVLLNRSHPYHDLILVIGPEEKRLFDAIDGRRSIAEIVDQTSESLSRSQNFFENLWCYDQVVFDTSKAR